MRSISDLSDAQLARLTPEQIARSGEDRGLEMIAVTVTLMGITCLVCGLRFFVRLRMTRNPGKDDLAVLVSLVLNIIYMTVSLSKISVGYGRHYWLQESHDLEVFLRLSKAHLILYQCAFVSVKVTFLLQYRRIFDLPSVRRICNYMIAVILVFLVSTVLVLLFGCRPLSILWHPLATKNIQCYNRSAFYYSNSIIHLVTDIVIIILPMPLLRMLPLRFLQKMVLVSIFGVGFFVTGISVLRIAYVIPATSSSNQDISYNMLDINYWSFGEVCGGLICVCIPTLRPLVRHLLNTKPVAASDLEKGDFSPGQGSSMAPINRPRRARPDSIDSDDTDNNSHNSPQVLIIETSTAGKLSTVPSNVASTTASERERNDTFWLGEDESDLDDDDEEKRHPGEVPDTPTPLQPPPRLSVLLTSPVLGRAELSAVRDPAELSADETALPKNT